MKNHSLDFLAASKRSINSASGRFASMRVMLSVLSLALSVSIAAPEIAAGERHAFPSIRLQAKARGIEAVRKLGVNLDKVASWYGMTPDRLAEILEKDADAWVDKSGRLLFIDQFPPVPEGAGSIDDSGSILDPGPYPVSDTFKLHSKPGAQRLIYLDFNGHTTTGSAWNSGTIVAPAFDLDGISTEFSNTELNRIQAIWQRVAEDFAPFNVDVTTEEPSPDLLNRTSSLDLLYGTRAVITHSSIGVCTGCGGVAYVGVFDWYSSINPTYYQSAWVLYDMLGAGDEKNVAEAISHEVGHTLGLSHDGTSTTGYYTGQGSGVTGWAPIMGIGYNQNTVQWSMGEYADANNKEDDLAIIQDYGLPLKADVVGDTKETAAPLGGTSAGGTVTVNAGGVIETRSDVDVFSFSSGGGPLEITVNPGLRSPNMDISLVLLDMAGNIITSSNPETDLKASLSATLSPGGYFLKIDGAGYGDPAILGYSDYASIGRYTISGTYTAATSVAPVAVASASPLSGNVPLKVGFSSNGSSDSDGTLVAYAWDFGDGTKSAEPNPLHTYSTAGTYKAVLTVSDSQGLNNSAGVTIVVKQNMAMTTLHVDSIVLRSIKTVKGKITSYNCTASVIVKNYSGALVSGATVNGLWTGATFNGLFSGATSGTARGITNVSGVATITGPKTGSRGTCTFAVSRISLSGWTYDPKQNVETRDSLTY